MAGSEIDNSGQLSGRQQFYEKNLRNARECDNDEWIVYDPEDDGDFRSWMMSNMPSELSSEDGIGWVSVNSPEDRHKEMDEEGLMLSWQSLQSSKQPITLKSISEIAKNHNVLVGKWMCFPSTGLKVDVLWEKISTAVVTGSLPPSISAKVSPTPNKYKNHVLLVYNQDFTNIEEVYELEHSLRQLGIKCKLSYKPDIYTYIGVYQGNPWDLSPVIYNSYYDILSKKSTITSI